MDYKSIYKNEDGVELFCSNTPLVEVMLDTKRFNKKPTLIETAYISRRLEGSSSTISVSELCNAVGRNGQTFIPAKLDGNGRKADNWIQQQVFALDFDENITLQEFDIRCLETGIQPVLVYKTFRHSDEHHKFRALFVLDHVVQDIRLRNFVHELLISIFHERDSQCSDNSRLFYGGNSVHRTNLEARLNPYQLFDGYLVRLKEKDPGHFARNRDQLLNKLGVDSGVLEVGVDHIDEIDTKYGESLGSSLIYKELTKNSPYSLVIFQSNIFRIHWKTNQNNESSIKDTPNNQVRKSHPSKYHPDSLPRLSIEDLNQLKTKCKLFREFVDGERRLKNPERRLLITNLRHRRNGLAEYKKGLKHFEPGGGVSDPYPVGDKELLASAKRYNWNPERCTRCDYCDSCDHGTNLLQHIPLRKNDCRKVAEAPKSLPLEKVRFDVKRAIESVLLDHKDRKDLSIVRADCGVGKTHFLLELMPQLNNICISFPTHRLAKEAYKRLEAIGNANDVFLWPDRPKLPNELQRELEKSDQIGISSIKEVCERALESDEVVRDTSWSGQIQDYLHSYGEIHRKRKIFCTHEKAVRLAQRKNGLIDTFVFDEDPMKSLFTIDQIKLSDVETAIKRLMASNVGSDAMVRVLESVLEAKPETLVIPESLPYSPESLDEITSGNEITTPVHRLMDCTGYIKPQINIGSEPLDVYAIRQRPLPDHKKHIIMSATPILPLYEKAYGDRLNYIDTPSVELKGRLFLHRDRSNSKSSIQSRKKDFIPDVEEWMEKFNLEGIITHKYLATESDSEPVLKGSSRKIPVLSTFGATEGFDDAAGKNIGVVGTPHMPEYAIKLLVHVSGENVEGISFKFAHRAVRRNEFELSLGCLSDNDFVQKLEFALVERELVQAVGRARLLENDSEVRLFSNYVLSGGNLWHESG